MSTTEALRMQLDQLQTRYNLLEVENRRLRDEKPQHSEELDLERELTETRQENIQLLQTITSLEAKLEEPEREREGEQGSLTCAAATMREQLEAITTELAEEKHGSYQARGRAEAAEDAKRLEADIEMLQQESELEKLRAVGEETRKWEAREARLVRWLDKLEGGAADGELPRAGAREDPSSTATTDCLRYVMNGDLMHEREISHTLARGNVSGLPDDCPGKADSPGELDLTPKSTCNTELAPAKSKAVPSGDQLSMALMAQQLPPLPKFTGDNLDEEAENIDEWLEQTELVAQGCGWSEQAKLFSVVAHLRGTASGFYRSCTPQQRSCYTLLSKALRQRFTPVRIQSVQSSRFHGRKQLTHETVDQYAQDRNSYKAYPPSQREAPGAQTMAQSVLTYQFVDGLVPELKAKLAGSEGSFEELLSKARFQEAHLRDVVSMEKCDDRSLSGPQLPKSLKSTAHKFGGNRTPRNPLKTNPKNDRENSERECWTCGGVGHFARNCPMKGRAPPAESRGGKQKPTNGVKHPGEQRQNAGDVRMMRTDSESETTEAISGVQSAVDEAVQRMMGTMHNIKTQGTLQDATLGPTPMSMMKLDSTPVNALLDTGSPTSIVSLDFYLKAAANSRTPDQSPAEWGKKVRQKLQPTYHSIPTELWGRRASNRESGDMLPTERRLQSRNYTTGPEGCVC